MAGNGLVDCSSITNDAQIPLVINAPSLSIAGKTVFADVPSCDVQPIAEGDIANKSYVDATLAAASGVTADTANTFTAVNSFVVGANIAIPTLAYASSTADPSAYVKYGPNQPSVSTQHNIWCFNTYDSPGNVDETWALPDAQSCAGCTIVLVNGSDGNSVTLTGVMRNCADAQNNLDKSGFVMKYGGSASISSMHMQPGFKWVVTSFNESNGTLQWL